MLMHWMTLRACMHSVVSILCMNIVCKTYMRDEAHWWCAHPQSWVITSRAQQTGRAENAEDGLWCERKDGLDKEKRKERTWTNQTDKSKQKKKTLSLASVSDITGKDSEWIYVQRCKGFRQCRLLLCKMRCHPMYCTRSSTGSPSQSSGLDWTHAQSVTSRSSYTLCLCVNMWAGMNVLNYECVCVCVCVTKETTTQSTATLGLMIHDVGRN